LVRDGEDVVCWTCGSTVDTSAIERTLDCLRSVRQEKLRRRTTLAERIEDTQAEVSRIERGRKAVERLEQRLADIEAELDRKRDRLATLEERRDELYAAVEDIETSIEATKTSDYGDLLDLHKQANQAEVDLEHLEDERSDLAAEITEIESLDEERETLERRRDDVSERITELRNRIVNLEADAVETFNEHIQEVLAVLEYDNIARIWIERTEARTGSDQSTPSSGRFDLHIVRETDDGAAFEGSVETLSESEREVTGLVFALAGYLVHDLHESVPVMVLASLEAIDADRINRLVDYFSGFAEYLVVAVLPEDAAAVEVENETITSF
jgi:DNA repair exonuclease SbcCD ATPase subunit